MEELYTVSDLTKILKINKNHIYELLNKGKIKYLILGGKKVLKSEIERFMKEANGKDLTDLDNIKEL